jgi:hypothetical protein
VKGKEEQGALFNGEEPVRRAEDPPFERTEGEDDEDL